MNRIMRKDVKYIVCEKNIDIFVKKKKSVSLF